MAKKTAKSKGYRKTKEKKPFLTKKEMIAAIVILVIFAFAMILVLNDDMLFYIFPDGNLAGRDIKDGQIATYADLSMKTRFVKIGDAGELEGFTRTTSFSNAGVPTSYTFTPDDEASNVTYASVSGSAVEAAKLPETYRETLSGLGASVNFTDTVETTIDGHTAYVYGYVNEYYDAKLDPDAAGEDTEDAEHPANVFEQTLSAYIDCDGKHTVCFHVTYHFDDGEQYIPDDKIEETVLSYAGSFTIDQAAA